LESTAEWFTDNKRTLLTGVSVAAAAAILLGGINIYVGQRESSAQSLFNEALEMYHGRIQESAVVQSATGNEFKSVEERYQKSLEAFVNVIEQFGSTKQGRQARYYAALCHMGLDQLEDAEKLLSEVAGGNRDLLHYLGSQALASVKTEAGDYGAAAEVYRRLVEDANNPLPRDVLLFNLAKVNEKAGHLEEAMKDYKRLLDEFPDSLLRSEVQTRNEDLEYRLES
jgi:tetratricopeptide (TPR) repeat protein